MLLTCDCCKQEVSISMYFHNPVIVKDYDPSNMTTSYTASVYGKAFCPHCGKEINEHFHHPINKQDIVTFAVQGCLQ